MVAAEKERPAREAPAETHTVGKVRTGSSLCRRSAGPWEEELPMPHAACPRQCVNVKSARPVNVLTSTFLSPHLRREPPPVVRWCRRAGSGLSEAFTYPKGRAATAEVRAGWKPGWGRRAPQPRRGLGSFREFPRGFGTLRLPACGSATRRLCRFGKVA